MVQLVFAATISTKKNFKNCFIKNITTKISIKGLYYNLINTHLIRLASMRRNTI